MSCDAFERMAGSLDRPMMIVTTRAGDEMDGCLVGFSTQCSIEPLRYLVCLSTKNRTYEIAQLASTVIVHVLHDNESDRALARRFGEQTGYDVDKLADCDWTAGPGSVPVINSCDWFGGPIVSRTRLGDHVGFVLEPQYGLAARASERYLTLADVADLDAGNPP
jgi:flavin reductase (DIM6/NTAB) family NADH-FMN oxidoreductase RutF